MPELLRYFPFENANADSWIKVLRTGMEIPNINWEYLNSIFSIDDWKKLLVAKPNYVCECGCLEEFTGELWAFLIARRPELEQYCEIVRGWEKFTETNWNHVLRHVPTLNIKRK